jgi:hypothetical protein
MLMNVIRTGDYAQLGEMLERGDYEPIEVLFELFEVDEQDSRLLKTVLLCWPDINTKSQSGESAIHMAAKAKGITYLRVLLHQTSLDVNL